MTNTTLAQDASRVNSLVLHNSAEPDLAYYPQLFILLPLPYQDPKSAKFTRKYGDYNLTFSSPYGILYRVGERTRTNGSV
ncbi:MAG: hypothetical protein LBM77_02390 [Spirochaetaceae bacterium]|nr:hypothetical protein [Spirochaetaceae bacterium]